MINVEQDIKVCLIGYDVLIINSFSGVSLGLFQKMKGVDKRINII